MKLHLKIAERSSRRTLLAAAFLAAVASMRVAPASAQTGVPTAAATAPAATLQSLIASGQLADLRWPNFSDYRASVDKFYKLDSYSLAWSQANQATPQAQALIRNFKNASSKGLRPEDYDASRWDGRLAAIGASGPTGDDARVRFDLAMTVCTMRYISGLHIGRINPQHFKFGLTAGPRRYDLAEHLRNQVVHADDIDAVIQKVEPPFAGYRRAEAALATYQKLAAAGDWPPLPVPDKGVRPRGTYPGLAPLVARLARLGDLPADTPAPTDTIYQGALVDGVKHFQRRHGLDIDGVLGKGTVAELNKPPSMRTEQLALTLERYRWSPPDFPEPPILVNIPEFRLRTFRGQPAPYLTMKVIVGRAFHHKTPVFADNMKYLIFRPYWNVPPSIQRAELVPKTIKDRDYLAANNFEVVDGSNNVVSDGTVSDDVLARLRTGALQIRQKPGPKNALGLVKFIFPNSYNVYLHSTPAPELFTQARRDFSHGCIRVEDPVALAVWVLRDNPNWNAAKIRATMNGDQTVQVNLAKPIPVLILYGTAVVEPDGEARFFNDIYGYDAELEAALAAGYPYPN